MEGEEKKGCGACVDGNRIMRVCQTNRVLAFELDCSSRSERSELFFHETISLTLQWARSRSEMLG